LYSRANKLLVAVVLDMPCIKPC